jgi:NAD(P)H-hydrate repair Nnr-like enzyme with NAD(P)H-hydrate dehydratase domain
MIGGLAARTGDPLTAVLWAVHVHGLAGERLGRRIGPLGFLARELLDELPGVLRQLSR